MATKKFSIRIHERTTKRVEALGYRQTKFIHEAMLEKLAREEGAEDVNFRSE